MATDGPTPPPCDREIFERGTPVATAYSSSNKMERWVCAVAKEAKVKMDWHYSGGIAQILCLGDEDDLSRARATIETMAHELEGQFVELLPIGHPGRYRQGVIPTPPNAVLAEETAAGTAFMVRVEK